MKKSMLICAILLLIQPSLGQLEEHAGFPVISNSSGLTASLVTADIDRDGKMEIIAAPDIRKVMVFNSSGVLLWENVSGIIYAGDTARVPVAKNLSGDNRLEILTYGNPGMSDPTFYLWDATGTKIAEMMVGRAQVPASPSVTKEGMIITAVRNGVSASPIVNGTGVHAFDTSGNWLWYLELGMNATSYASIPVVDLDNDGLDEAVVLTQDEFGIGTVWAVKLYNTHGTVLWSRQLEGDARKVAAGDLNNDSRNEIVVLSTGGVNIFDGSGNQLNRFNLNSNLSATPAIGDLDRDGINEVVFASHNEKKIYIISNGSVREFPTIQRVGGNVALGDLNMDGRLEILAGDNYGFMNIWYDNGTLIDRVQIQAGTTFSSALISDIDHDGNKELILGNSNAKIYVYTYRIMSGDTIAPVTTDNVDGLWHNSSLTVTLTADDTGSGVENTYYTIDGSIPTIDSPAGTTIVISNDGIYNISYFSMDYAGNAEPVKNAMNQVKLDMTPPSTSDDADDLWHSTAVTLNLLVSDSLSGVASLYYRVDGLENLSSGNVTLVFTEEGVHNVEYYGTDNAGNNETQKNALVKLDMTPPSTTDNVDGLWHNSSVNVSLSGIDSLSGVNATYNKVTSVPLSVLDSFFSWLGGIFGMAEGYAEGDNATLSGEGIYVVTYYSNDHAGNTEAEKVTGQVRIDKTLPTTTVTVPLNRTYLQSESITLDFSAQDSLSGIKRISGSIDGIRPVSSGEVLNMGTLGGGGHEFILTAEDNASNLNTQTVPFSVAGAEISGTGFINGTITSGGLPVSGASVYTINASTTTDINGNYSLVLQPGAYDVTASKQPEYYEKNTTDVVVTSSNTTTVYFVMTAKPTGTLGGSVRSI